MSWGRVRVRVRVRVVGVVPCVLHHPHITSLLPNHQPPYPFSISHPRVLQGEPGLATVLKNMAALTVRGGSLLIEPQDKKCYKMAAKRCRKLGIPAPAFAHLLLPAVINAVTATSPSERHPLIQT